MPFGRGELGPILGRTECSHTKLRWFDGIEGVYAVCTRCGGHLWNRVPPPDVKPDKLEGVFDD